MDWKSKEVAVQARILYKKRYKNIKEYIKRPENKIT